MHSHVMAAIALGAAMVTAGWMLTPGGVADAEAQSTPGQGRYALLTGEYTVTSDGGVAKQVTGLFKIDSTTGAVWRYTEHVRKDGEVRTRWVVTNDREE